MTVHCSAALIRPQRAISSSVRLQPMQTRAESSTQTFMQGEAGPACVMLSLAPYARR